VITADNGFAAAAIELGKEFSERYAVGLHAGLLRTRFAVRPILGGLVPLQLP
jgi:hypothetical protein